MNIIIAAMGCIFNDKGEVLLALRNDPQSPKVHHKWQLPGGGVEDGETVTDAVIREVREETGLIVKITSNLPAVTFGTSNPRKHTDGTRILLIAYPCKIIGGKLGENISKETAKLAWFSKDGLPIDILPGNKEVICPLNFN